MPEKVLIGVPCREQGRWSLFWECLLRLKRPPGTEVRAAHNNSVAQARNEIAAYGLRAGYDAIFWLDDDLVFADDVLMRMLARPEAILIGLSMLRHYGQFKPIWSQLELEQRGGEDEPLWQPVDQIVTEANGLMPLKSGTGGGVLTRIEVFKTVPAPWWTMGQIVPDMFWEDIWFYQAARAAGFDVWGDPSVRFGHYKPGVIWPHERPDGTWSTVLADGFEGFWEQPWAVPVKESHGSGHHRREPDRERARQVEQAV